MGISPFKKCYEACIGKITDYSAGVWGLGAFTKIKAVHNRTLRSYFCINKYALLAAIQGKMGLTLPAIRRKIEIVRFWNNLLSLDQNTCL